MWLILFDFLRLGYCNCEIFVRWLCFFLRLAVNDFYIFVIFSIWIKIDSFWRDPKRKLVDDLAKAAAMEFYCWTERSVFR
jgi:hypothetical protein